MKESKGSNTPESDWGPKTAKGFQGFLSIKDCWEMVFSKAVREQGEVRRRKKEHGEQGPRV